MRLASCHIASSASAADGDCGTELKPCTTRHDALTAHPTGSQQPLQIRPPKNGSLLSQTSVTRTKLQSSQGRVPKQGCHVLPCNLYVAW